METVILDTLAVRRVAFPVPLYTDSVYVKGIVELFNN
jgi:hypothetical protein